MDSVAEVAVTSSPDVVAALILVLVELTIISSPDAAAVLVFCGGIFGNGNIIGPEDGLLGFGTGKLTRTCAGNFRFNCGEA